MSSDMHFKGKECEHPSNVIQALSRELLYNWVSHIFSFHLEGWYCSDLVVVFLSSSLPCQIV